MTTSQLHPSLIECYAYVEGVSDYKMKTLVSAKSLPATGRTYRTLCKWPRQTAVGYDDQGEFWWATVTRNGDEIFVTPSKIQANSVAPANSDSYRHDLMLILAVWVVCFALAVSALIATK